MKYKIKRANLKKDKQEIIALWRRNFADSVDERYAWLYEANPYGPALCWLAKDINNQSVIGSTALFPRKVIIERRPYSAWIAGDFSVDKEHRAFGPALQLQKKALSESCTNKFNLIYGFPNKHSEPIQLRAGYRVAANILSLTRPLRSNYFFSRYIKSPFPLKLASKFSDIALACASRETYSHHTKRYSIETPSHFDERFDTFWQKVQYQFPVISDRSSSYLNWRYKQAPHKSYRIFTLVTTDNSQILGYIVYNIRDNTTYIDDLITIQFNKLMDILLSTFISLQRQSNIQSISIHLVENRFLLQKLRKYNFFIRGKIGSLIYYSSPDLLNLNHSMPNLDWYLLQGDSDV